MCEDAIINRFLANIIQLLGWNVNFRDVRPYFLYISDNDVTVCLMSALWILIIPKTIIDKKYQKKQPE